MSRTFTEQVRPSFTGLLADAQPMHSLFPFDMPRFVNNLGTYCNNHMHCFAGAADATSVTSFALSIGVTGTHEAFMCQIPIKAAPWAERMLWTAGVSVHDGGTVSAVKVYLSPAPYTGVGSDNGSNIDAFDTSNLNHGYSVRTVSGSISSGTYRLYDDTTTGILLPWNKATSHDEGLGRSLVTYLIITITGTSTINLHDFTCWFVPS